MTTSSAERTSTRDEAVEGLIVRAGAFRARECARVRVTGATRFAT